MNLSAARTISLATRSVNNYFLKRPFCVSFEITYNCNARCKHCHLGGTRPETQASPERYAEICRAIRPVVAQISGGEPLLRPDLPAILRAIRRPNRAPFIVLTTNGALLDRKTYLALRDAGVDEFSLSLDYPDERQDEFRNIPGLFGRIRDLLSSFRPGEPRAITLACVVQSDNYRGLIEMAEFARRWRVKLNFSTYTWLRTQKKHFMVPRDRLPELRSILRRVLEHKRKWGVIRTSSHVLRNMVTFFERECIPGCRAGERFLIVNPGGTLSPCGLVIKNYPTTRIMRREFRRDNDCTWCYTSIRGNSEKPAFYLFIDTVRS